MERPLPSDTLTWFFHIGLKELDELFAELGMMFIGRGLDYSKKVLRLAIVHLPYRAGFLGGGGAGQANLKPAGDKYAS